MTASAPGDVETLRERMADLCASAVDPLEVTAGLEAEGINDEAARGYGHPDVFALAEDLYARTPRRPPPAEASEAPWRAVPWRHLLRGVLFGLPGLCYIAGAPVLNRTGAGVLLVFSLLLSWAVSQGTAYLGYVRLGIGDGAAASRVLRWGLAAGLLVVVPVTAVAGVVTGAGPMATALSAGLCGYLLSATVVQVNGAEVRLLLALLPGVTAVVIHLAGRGSGTPGTVPAAVWVAWAVTLAATLALAIRCTASARGHRRPAARPVVKGAVVKGAVVKCTVVTRREVAAALPFAVFGLLTGGLLTFTLLCSLAGRPLPPGTMTVAVLSLSLSMGGAEWILYAYRRRVYDLLRAHIDVAEFARAARAVLAYAIARYLASLLTLVAVAALVAGLLAGLPGTAATGWTLGGFIALGCVFFLSLVLQACGRLGAVLAGFGCALAAEVAAAVTLPDVPPGTVQAAVAGALLVFLSTYAGRVLARATSHR